LSWRSAETLAADDFWPSFVAVGVLTGCSAFFFARLMPNAGDEISGHGVKPTPPAPKEA
jgi:hypothetical protein